ncbi:hypothetical protein NX722_13815 [Endozoicomonas gorgoniicola]|uniref:Uncharacterized protein n=1 Tax=Endozoicomonas gorgoniicola TaxID=1234144 RepID=A0ABT3MWC5_9GAMM|nr:hypothetical protein [Endozoicomonas gorgoniicola]MCW7553686.1 hypothetical protein [Endozoicomonas gorgoniicola]
MEILNEVQVRDIISQGRSASENIITTMLDEIEADYPTIYRFIYGEPSDDIATINKDMANLYLDLSCDVIWFYVKSYGNPPKLKSEEEWTLGQLSLIDAELKSLKNEISINKKIKNNLQERFIKRSLEANIQLELMQYLQNEVAKYASFKKARSAASQVTNNYLFILVRLLGDLYSSETRKEA